MITTQVRTTHITTHVLKIHPNVRGGVGNNAFLDQLKQTRLPSLSIL